MEAQERDHSPLTKIIWANILVEILLLCMIAVLFWLSRRPVQVSRAADVLKGREFVSMQENQDVPEIEDAIFASRKRILLNELEDRLAQDPDYVWSALDQINTVILGDSRAVAFSAYGFMDASRVLADGGVSIRVIPDHLEELKVIRPNLVVIAYGLNDTGWYWSTPEEYAQELMEYAGWIQAMLPDTHIYIQSVLLPQESVDEAYDNPGLYYRVREWNEAEMAIFRENGCRCIDMAELVEQHQDLFLEDGVHFQPAFYPLWAETILKQYMADTMETE